MSIISLCIIIYFLYKAFHDSDENNSSSEPIMSTSDIEENTSSDSVMTINNAEENISNDVNIITKNTDSFSFNNVELTSEEENEGMMTNTYNELDVKGQKKLNKKDQLIADMQSNDQLRKAYFKEVSSKELLKIDSLNDACPEDASNMDKGIMYLNIAPGFKRMGCLKYAVKFYLTSICFTINEKHDPRFFDVQEVTATSLGKALILAGKFEEARKAFLFDIVSKTCRGSIYNDAMLDDSLEFAKEFLISEYANSCFNYGLCLINIDPEYKKSMLDEKYFDVSRNYLYGLAEHIEDGEKYFNNREYKIWKKKIKIIAANNILGLNIELEENKQYYISDYYKTVFNLANMSRENQEEFCKYIKDVDL